MRILRLVLGIPAITLLFLPYVYSTSPWAAVRGWNNFFGGPQIALMGAPFFLAVLIFTAEAQLLLKKSFPKTERAICNTFAYAALACGLVLLALGIQETGFDKEMIRAFLIFGIPFLTAVSLMFWARRLGPEKATLVVMRAAWLPNAITCAISFWSEKWQIGAYLAAITIVLYAAEIALFLAGKENMPEWIASSESVS